LQSTDGTGTHCYIKWSNQGSEKQVVHGLTYIWTLKVEIERRMVIIRGWEGGIPKIWKKLFWINYSWKRDNWGDRNIYLDWNIK
jgi:hypothetical protein